MPSTTLAGIVELPAVGDKMRGFKSAALVQGFLSVHSRAGIHLVEQWFVRIGRSRRGPLSVPRNLIQDCRKEEPYRQNQGIDRVTVSEIVYAVLERNGDISIIPNSSKQSKP